MMTFEEMMDAMIKRFGFEDEITIAFCRMIEEGAKLERMTFIFTVLMR